MGYAVPEGHKGDGAVFLQRREIHLQLFLYRHACTSRLLVVAIIVRTPKSCQGSTHTRAVSRDSGGYFPDHLCAAAEMQYTAFRGSTGSRRFDVEWYSRCLNRRRYSHLFFTQLKPSRHCCNILSAQRCIRPHLSASLELSRLRWNSFGVAGTLSMPLELSRRCMEHFPDKMKNRFHSDGRVISTLRRSCGMSLTAERKCSCCSLFAPCGELFPPKQNESRSGFRCLPDPSRFSSPTGSA